MDSALPNASFVQLLEQLIESKYRERGDPLKWALLYSPADVLEGSPVAFIGLNPGGDTVPEGPSAVAREKGSAYCDPNWREDGKLASLQKQVCLLFAQLGIEPENVLAGNLVPFRSANWDTLQYPQALWSSVRPCGWRSWSVRSLGASLSTASPNRRRSWPAPWR